MNRCFIEGGEKNQEVPGQRKKGLRKQTSNGGELKWAAVIPLERTGVCYD